MSQSLDVTQLSPSALAQLNEKLPPEQRITEWDLKFLQKYEDYKAENGILFYEPIPKVISFHKSEAPYRLLHGANRCIDGDTLIHNPVTKKSQKVKEIQSSFFVHALNGDKIVVAKAERPFLKGFDRIYRVEFSDGQSILVTHAHRFLTASGWKELRELNHGSVVIGAASCLLESGVFSSSARRSFGSAQEEQLYLQSEGQAYNKDSQGCSFLLASQGVCNPCNEQSLSFSQCHAESSGAHDQKVLLGDGQSYLKKVQDSQSDCRAESHSCGELPLLEEGFYLGVSPLLSGVQKRTFSGVGGRWGGQDNTQGCSPVLSSAALQSNSDAHLRFLALCASFLYQIFLPILRLFGAEPLTVVQSKHESCHPSQSSSSVATQNSCKSDSVHAFSPPFIESKIMGPIDAKVYGKIIKRITFVKYDFFFDFHVPKFENYLACGVFNHNSSKTYSGAAEDVFYALGNHPYKKIQVPNEGWVVSPSYKQQVEGVQATILKLLPAKSIKDKNYVKSEVINSIWIIPHGFPLDTPKEKCSKITFKSCDAGEREFAGAAKRWIHFDEEPPRGIWNEALARIGAGMPLDIWLTMTPIFENSGKKVGMTWTYRELYRKRDNKRIFCLGVGIEDNIYLSKEQIEEQKRKYHGAEYDIRIKGEFKLLAGNQVFNPEKLEAMEHYITEPQAVGNLELDSHGNVKFVENNRGLVRIWEFPQKDTAYAVGGDVGLGVGGDPSCAQVLSMDNVDQCAELTGQVNPELFGKLSMWLAQYYNQAWLGIEANSFGIAAIDSIKKSYAKLYYRYRVDHRSDTKTKQIGWWTDTKTKPIMISDMARALNDGSVIIRSNMALDEFATYVIGSDGNANAELGCHDDRVVALMIALQVRKRFYQAGNSTTSTHAPEFKPASSAGGY